MGPRKSSSSGAGSASSMALFCAMFLLGIVLFISGDFTGDETLTRGGSTRSFRRRGSHRCNGIYVVGEDETLHSISDKCGDPFIVEQNPHINDADDVFPGLILKITPATGTSSTH